MFSTLLYLWIQILLSVRKGSIAAADDNGDDGSGDGDYEDNAS